MREWLNKKKKGQKINEGEMEVLTVLRTHLENGEPLRKLKLTEKKHEANKAFEFFNS